MSSERHQFIHGFRAIEEVIAASPPGAVLYLSRNGQRHRRLKVMALSVGLPVRHVSEIDLSRHVEVERHRGALLRVRDRQRRRTSDRQLSELVSGFGPNALILAVDRVTDSANLGAILRSAEGFGVDLVVLQEDRATSVNPTAMRTAAGAAAHLSIVTVTNLSRVLVLLQQHGFWVVAADMKGEPLYSFEFFDRSVLVVGSEGGGIRHGVRSRCDACVTVETGGKVGSLNVAVAAGIILYRASQCFAAKREKKPN